MVPVARTLALPTRPDLDRARLGIHGYVPQSLDPLEVHHRGQAGLRNRSRAEALHHLHRVVGWWIMVSG